MYTTILKQMFESFRGFTIKSFRGSTIKRTQFAFLYSAFLIFANIIIYKYIWISKIFNEIKVWHLNACKYVEVAALNLQKQGSENRYLFYTSNLYRDLPFYFPKINIEAIHNQNSVLFNHVILKKIIDLKKMLTYLIKFFVFI